METMYRQLSKILTKQAKRKFVLLTIFCAIGAVFETFSISLIFPYVAILSSPETIFSNHLISDILSALHLYDKKSVLIFLTILLIIGFFLKNVFLYFSELMQRKFIMRECIHASKKMLRSYLNKPYQYFLNHNSNEISNVVNEYITKSFVLVEVFMKLLSELIICFLLTLLMCFVDWSITIIMIVAYIIITIGIKQTFHKKMIAVGQASNENYTKMLITVTQAIQGIQEVKLLQRELQIIEEYDIYGQVNLDAEVKGRLYSSLPRYVIEFLSITIMLLLILFALNTSSTAILFAKLSSFAMILIRIMPSVNRMNSYINQINFYKPSLMKIDEEISELLNESITNKKSEPISFQNRISFQHVSFQYKNNVNVLEDINLEIKKGSIIGIMGESGGGKTTFVNLLLGLIEPCDGKILVDEINIKNNIKGWYSLLGYIPQSLFMLDGTIKENILFYRECNEEKLWDALEKASLKEFVLNLDEGLDTKIGERGIMLSGGQRQRLGIARAIYNDATVFVFDEATASLDYDLEREVMNAIYSLNQGQTIIIIAHRLNTLEKCDHIYEIGNSQIRKVK